MRRRFESLRVTVMHQDREYHIGYASAIRTLCGRVFESDEFGRFLDEDEGIHPDCQVCNAVLDRWVFMKLENPLFEPVPHCTARTRKHLPCQREPLPQETLCPSHIHLKELVA